MKTTFICCCLSQYTSAFHFGISVPQVTHFFFLPWMRQRNFAPTPIHLPAVQTSSVEFAIAYWTLSGSLVRPGKENCFCELSRVSIGWRIKVTLTFYSVYSGSPSNVFFTSNIPDKCTHPQASSVAQPCHLKVVYPTCLVEWTQFTQQLKHTHSTHSKNLKPIYFNFILCVCGGGRWDEGMFSIFFCTVNIWIKYVFIMVLPQILSLQQLWSTKMTNLNYICKCGTQGTQSLQWLHKNHELLNTYKNTILRIYFYFAQISICNNSCKQQ